MKTDKFKDGLMDEYYRLFSPYKSRAIKLLEIGTYNNGFLEWAEDYFKEIDLYGMDSSCRSMGEQNITLIQANQNDTKTLKEISEKYGDFDIIIDDASHFAKETENTFNVFWRNIKEGGVYIIEDWIVGYWNNTGENKKREGMEKLIANLIIRKKELNIKNLEILLKEPLCSLACFYK